MKKALVISAHPDDSFIFAHNLMNHLLHRGWRIDELVATYQDGSARGREFVEACRLMGTNPIFLGHEDDPYTPLPLMPPDFYNLHLDYDLIVTHGPNGEYGHGHHRQMHAWVIKYARCPVLCFAHNRPFDFALVNLSKLQSPLRQVYERESYMVDNFNLPFEAFAWLQSEHRGLLGEERFMEE